MRWTKKGLIFSPVGQFTWASHSALTPTPVLLDGYIRVFAGFRDAHGISRIGYVDLDSSHPEKILGISRQPVLNIGEPGAFDDNGVILGDVVRSEDEWRMYYVGFQVVERAKFLAFTGLAMSEGDCTNFRRASVVPVLDRSPESPLIRAAHTCRRENGIWKMWYASGLGWVHINGVPYPSYDIRYLESRDGVDWPIRGTRCIEPAGDEYRVGRPRVWRRGATYCMLFTKGDRSGRYLPGYAESDDGVHWTRKDEVAGLALSSCGWDSQTLCYAAPIEVSGRTYLFYNGNSMGYDGFGCAELINGD